MLSLLRSTITRRQGQQHSYYYCLHSKAVFAPPAFGTGSTLPQQQQQAPQRAVCFHSSTRRCNQNRDSKKKSSSSSSASSSSKNISSRDTRLAGRRRFYKTVNVASHVLPPWETSTIEDGNDDDDDNTTTTTTMKEIDSPISAGVDGTQSATGVVLDLERQKQQLLLPRAGGDNNSNNDNDNIIWYGISLDDRLIRTPLGQRLAVPSLPLACAIAAEWESMTQFIKPVQMPLMTLSCTALDQTALQPETYRTQSLAYLRNDTTCYWADPSLSVAHDRALHKRQTKAWKDIHLQAEAILGHAPAHMGTSEGLLMSMRSSSSNKEGAGGSGGLPHPPEVIEKATAIVESLDAWQLTALFSIASESKSFLVALCMVIEASSGGAPLSPKAAVAASRVEEEFQIESWGLVEGGHDYDRLNCSIQMHAAQVLLRSIEI